VATVVMVVIVVVLAVMVKLHAARPVIVYARSAFVVHTTLPVVIMVAVAFFAVASVAFFAVMTGQARATEFLVAGLLQDRAQSLASFNTALGTGREDQARWRPVRG